MLINLDTVRARLPHESCDCGKPADLFTATMEETRYVCRGCYLAQRERERAETRAAMHRHFPSLRPARA